MRTVICRNFFEYRDKIIKLRNIAFNRENDTDQYDEHYDHIIVLDDLDQEVIGCYRIYRLDTRKTTPMTGHYYDINYLLNIGKSAELGRAAVHPDYRDGTVLLLLWGGIAKYIAGFELKYLFGTSSYQNPDYGKLIEVGQQILGYIADNNAISDLEIRPFEKYRISNFELNGRYKKNFIPPLIKGYIRTGAKFIPEPLHDPDFQSIEFFTILDSNNITDRYRKFMTYAS